MLRIAKKGCLSPTLQNSFTNATNIQSFTNFTNAQHIHHISKIFYLGSKFQLKNKIGKQVWLIE